MNQINIHNRIDEIIGNEPTNADAVDLRNLIETNFDAEDYFYSFVGSEWVMWLWENGFLLNITVPASDKTKYSYRMPELKFLVRAAESTPAEVATVLRSVTITEDNFNPEVVDQFLRICAELPVDELVKEVDRRSLIEKIKQEEWPRLMVGFNRWGFDYQQILKKLLEAESYESLLTLAEAVLAVQPVDDVRQSDLIRDRSWFYFNDFSHMDLFQILDSVPEQYSEEVIALLSSTLQQIIERTLEESDESDSLPYHDKLWLSDVDFFDLPILSERGYDSMSDVKNLIACMRSHTIRLFEVNNNEQGELRRIFNAYYAELSTTQTIWRLKLSVFASRPEVFKDVLTERINSLFTAIENEKRYTQLTSGTEYQRALQSLFPLLTTDEQRAYIANVLYYFLPLVQERPGEVWHLSVGSGLLSCIAEYVHSFDDLHQEAIAAGFSVNKKYKPEPGVIRGLGGAVQSRGPISQEDFDAMTIDEILECLQSEWTPESLRIYNKDEDFLRPINVDGVGELLQINMQKRLVEYITRATDFFSPDTLDIHYTYAYLQGVERVLKDQNALVVEVSDWQPLFTLITNILQHPDNLTTEGRNEERSFSETWLMGWPSIHTTIVNVVREMMRKHGGRHAFPIVEYKSEILEVIIQELQHPDPDLEKESPGTASMTTQLPNNGATLVSDPFTLAINTVRGRMFEGFVMYIEIFDQQELSETSIKILTGVVTSERTRALYFLFGRHLPFFFSRSREWTLSDLLPLVFIKKPDDKYLRDAAWEGYLSGNLYSDLFFAPEMQQLYREGIRTEKEETRQYFRDPDLGVATHIALATIVYHADFTFDHPLFVAFWEESTEEQQRTFVKEIGRIFVSSDNERTRKLYKKDPQVMHRLTNLWDWLLDKQLPATVYSEFGFWIKDEMSIFELPWLAEHIAATLEKSNGVLEWEYGLTKMIEQLVAASPEYGYHITHSFLAMGAIEHQCYMSPIRYEREWYRAIELLYSNTETKNRTIELIDYLIEHGGSDYWELKQILLKD